MLATLQTRRVANNRDLDQRNSPGAWVKKYYLASQALIEAVLRPYDIGPTQWFVLHRLANHGPTRQRDLVLSLGVERATVSGIAAALVRKGYAEQVPDTEDHRQKTLVLTDQGAELWARLPDPIAHALSVAFGEVDQRDQDFVVQILQEATTRLTQNLKNGTPHP